MITIVDAASEAPYGHPLHVVDDALLARSHAAWRDAGVQIAPPNRFGHVLVWLACAAGGVGLAAMALCLAALSLPDMVLPLARSRVPALDLIAADAQPIAVFFAGFVVAFLSIAVYVGLLGMGKRMLRAAPQRAARAVSSRNVARRRWLWASASVLVAAGTIMFALPFRPLFIATPPIATGDVPMFDGVRFFIDNGIGVVGMGVLLWGLFRMQAAWQLGRATAAETQAVDPRAPVVLLRSFRDDALQILRETQNTKGRATTFVRLEEAVADQFEPFGPLVAIGRPGEQMPALGAARNYHSDAEWKDAVQAWMDKAQILLLIPGLTPGLGWELAEIERRGHIAKLLVLMPPTVGNRLDELRSTAVIGATVGVLSKWLTGTDVAEKKRADLQQRWSVLRAATQGVAAFASLPEAVPDGTIVLHLGRDGRPVAVCGGAAAEETDFEQAIRLGIYGMFCHARSGPMDQGTRQPR